MNIFSYEDYRKYRNAFSYYLTEDSFPYSYSNNNNIHDKIYRDLLNNQIEFSLFLKHFLNYFVDPNDLIKYNRSYIGKDYSSSYSDIVFKIKNKPIYIFVEHQSSIDNTMPFRILEYYTSILRDTTDFPRLKNKENLPYIIPILLYSGIRKWKLNPTIPINQYKDDDFIKKNKYLQFNYEFISIHDYSKETLRNKDSIISYILAIYKCKSKKELYDVLDVLSTTVTDISRRASFRKLITYAFSNLLDTDVCNELLYKFKERSDENMKCVWDYVKEDIAKEKREAIRAGKLQGRKEGIAEGREEGRKEGLKESRLIFVKEMLKNGEDIDKIRLYSKVSLQEIKKIQKELHLA